MKKIGIMSMQRVINYGSFLQAYGLKKIIESLGYKVEFVDYKFGNVIIQEKKVSFIQKVKNNKSISNFLHKKIYNKNQRKIIEQDSKKFLNLTEEKNYAYDNVEKLVIGSDEVFNCMQPYPVGYSKELFGYNYIDKMPVISYAACFGSTTLKKLKEHKIDKEVANMLSKFKSISVRDNNSYNIVKDLINKESNINLDPVLISNFDKEMIDNVKYNNYIIVYAYINRLTSNEEKYIKAFAKRNNKKIISLCGYQKIADYNLTPHPFEIYSYFKHADFIITDTFHGSIFSIKNHAKFATIIRNGNNGNSNKLYDLLNRLDRTDRIVNSLDDIDKLYNKDIDYTKTDKIIEEETKKSISYLKENLI